MKRPRFRIRQVLAIGSMTSVALVAAPAPAHAVVAAAGPGAFQTGYATRVVITAKGGPVTFFNGDVADHSLTAADARLPKRIARKTARCRAYSARSCPLFSSPVIAGGQSAEVDGLGRVKPGRQYEFQCVIHNQMKGTLVVAGAPE